MNPDGERFVDAIVARAKAAGISEIVAVLPAQVALPAGDGTRVVVNRNPLGEQIESLRLGLSQLTNTPATCALAWPVDHPFVSEETVRILVAAAADNPGRIVIPVKDGRRGHPVSFPRDLWRELVTSGAAGGTGDGARGIVRAHASDVLELQVNDVGILRDIDTRDDLRAKS